MIAYPLAVDGILTRVLEAGAGSNHVVFIHGLGARADRWRQNMATFARQGFHCYAIDLPGHGFAAKGRGFDYCVPAYAGFLTGFLDVMGIDRAFLVGTSLGGHVAGYVACEIPDRVRAMVLVGAVGLIPIGAEAGDAIRRSVRETSPEKIEAKLNFVLADSSLVTPELVAEEHRINVSPGAAEAFELLGDYIALRVDADNVGDRLAAMPARPPLILVWGREDKAVPLTIGQQASELLGGAQLVVIDGAGHAPYMEKPEEFEPPVLAFLSDHR